MTAVLYVADWKDFCWRPTRLQDQLSRHRECGGVESWQRPTVICTYPCAPAPATAGLGLGAAFRGYCARMLPLKSCMGTDRNGDDYDLHTLWPQLTRMIFLLRKQSFIDSRMSQRKEETNHLYQKYT